MDAETENPFISRSAAIHELSTAELKHRFLASALQKQKEQLCTRVPITFACYTWNVHGREPKEDVDLSFLVPEEMADVVVYGLQEVDRRPEAYMAAVKSREEAWTSRLERLLNARGNVYFKVASQIMVSVMIVVFARIELADAVSQITTSMASCGILGIVGNKGGVGVRLKVYEDYLCFINCHLAAHEKQVMRRNQDFADLHDRLLFYSATANAKALPKHARLLDPYVSMGTVCAGLLDSDVVVWLGDFNYRVEMESELVRTCVSQGQLSVALGCDQMRRELKRVGSHFSNYTEAPIVFVPSYSYDVGSDAFDSSDRKRVPSWCDRILWRRDDPIEARTYDCIMQARFSDHKPVVLTGTATVRKANQQLFDEAYMAVLRTLDSFENAAIPDTRVLSHAIHLGAVRFRQSAHSFIDLENQGKVLAQYRFLSVDPDSGPLPFWMRIAEPQGLVLPGSSMPIAVEAGYDVEVARQAAAQGSRFEAILVLHIEGGKDHFVSVSFEAAKTVFGQPLDCLKFHNFMLDSRHTDRLYHVPTAVWRLVDHLLHNDMALSNAFMLAGDRDRVDGIIRALDANEPFPDDLKGEAGNVAVADALLQYLEALPTPLISEEVAEQMLVAKDTAAHQLHLVLAEKSRQVFEYIFAYLRHHLLPTSTLITPTILATVFARVLLCKKFQSNSKKFRIVVRMLEGILLTGK